MRQRIEFPAYLPDQLPGNVLTVAQNVYPAATGYRAAKSYQAITDPLPALFRGGASFISSDGTAYLLAGTANGLNRLSGGSWVDLLVAMSVTGRWQFAQFGDNVVAVNGIETKEVDLVAGTASTLTGAPNGVGVAIVGPHVVITQADGNDYLVQWSAFNDHTAWTPAVDQAGFQPMLTGGEVMGIAGGEYGVILQRFRLVRMMLTGEATAPFTFQEITTNFGCASRGSIAQAGRTVFFLSDRGFMALDDGAAIRPIGNEKFDQTFRDSISPEDYERIWAAVDPKRTLVMWGVEGVPGTVWVYNWVLDRASTLRFGFNGLFSGFESGLTLEALAVLYPDLDTMPMSLDDPRFNGGDPRFYVVGSDNTVGSLSGPNMAAAVETGWLEPVAPNVARIRGAWPNGDAIEGVRVIVDARQRQGDTQAVRTSGDMQPSGRAPLRASGKSVKVRVEHEAGAEWSYLTGVDLEMDRAGLRHGG